MRFIFHTQLQSSSTEMDHLSTADEPPHNQILLTLNVTGPQQQTKLQTGLPARPAFMGNFLDKTEQDIQRRFVVESNPDFSMNRIKFKDGRHYRYTSSWRKTVILKQAWRHFWKITKISIYLTVKTLHRYLYQKQMKFHACSLHFFKQLSTAVFRSVF